MHTVGRVDRMTLSLSDMNLDARENAHTGRL